MIKKKYLILGIILVILLISVSPAHALKSYYDPASDVTADWATCTGADCGTGRYAVLDDAVRLPTAPSTVDDFITQDSASNAIDEHAVGAITESNINYITLWAYVSTYDTTSPNHQITISFQNDNVEVNQTVVAPTSTITAEWVSVPWDNPGVPGSLTAEFSSFKSGGGANSLGWVYAWYLEVDYEAVEPPSIDDPADQTTELGNETTIYWNIGGDNGDKYWVKRNGTLFDGPTVWSGNTTIVIRPNVYFLGNWNYTMFYNTTTDINGSSETILSVIDNENPSCSDATGGSASGTGALTLVNITVDGDIGEWDSVITNPLNVVTDLTELEGDPDTGQTSDRDMTAFAYTYNSQYINFYFARTIKGSRQVSMIVYLDYDLDGLMENTDQVVKFVWSGSNRYYDTNLYDYVPDVGGGDTVGGDGYDMPGSTTLNNALEQDVLGGSEAGTELETQVLWTDLGLSGPTVINFKASSALGSGTNLPSQLEDNVGGVLSGESSFFIFSPNRAKSTKNGTTIYYDHDIMNCGNSPTQINLTNITSQGWNVTLFYPYENESTITDTNGDGVLDITLSGEEYNTIIARVTVPAAAALGTVDIANITANTTKQSISVLDTTTIADIAISPLNHSSYATQGLLVSFNYTVYNYQTFNDVIEVAATSDSGWTVSLYYANGTALSDTDSDTIVDVGTLLPSQSMDIIAQVQVLSGAVSGTIDNVTVRINSSVDTTNTQTSTAIITVRDRLTMVPDGYNRTVTSETRQYYLFNITNNWNESDTINLTYTNTQNWATTFVDANRQALTDTDSDGYIDTGPIAAYGGSKIIYAKIFVPTNTTMGESEITTINANSTLNTSLYNTGIINSTPRGVSFYTDPSRSTRNETFEVEDTVYARAFYLPEGGKVFLIWYDGQNPINRSNNITITAEGTADDQTVTNISLGLSTWTVIVYNASTNSEITRNTFTLIDTILPNVTNFLKPSLNSSFNMSDTIEITANVSDNYMVNNDSVYANISYPNGSSYLLKLSNLTEVDKNTDNTYNNTFTLTIASLIGTYNVTILANDTSNNINNTETTNFTVYDDIAPTIIIDYPTNGSTYNWTNWPGINGTATDPYLDDIWTNNPTWPTVDTDLSPFNFTNTSKINGGWYTITIFANDTSNNINSTDVYFYFNNVTADVTLPIITLDYPVNGTYYDPSNWTGINGTATDANLFSIYTNDTIWPTVDTSSPFNFTNTSEIITGWHSISITANDSSNNINSTDVYFYFDSGAPSCSVAIGLSTNLSNGINWDMTALPAVDQAAEGNNGTGVTGYNVSIVATGCTVDLYIKANGDLTTGSEVIGLGNETYRYNTTNSTVPGTTYTPLDTTYAGNQMGSNLGNGDYIYLKFFLSVPGGQPPGDYDNTVSIKGVKYGEPP